MTVNVLNRMTLALGIGAVMLLGPGSAALAHPPPQDQARQGDQQKESKDHKEKKEAKAQHQRLTPQDQQALIHQQEQRLAQYGEHLDQQQRLAEQRSAELQQENRRAQYSYQQQYRVRLQQQQQGIQRARNYDYDRDPYFYTPPSYRYSRGGRYYETNQYGVDLLRQAVSYGYGEGCRAGMADRQDRWASNYEGSYAYQDANYGYTGFYVDRDDYNGYFREGFRRGYEDGYSGRYQYGRYASGRGTIFSAVLATIVNFEPIR